MKERPCIDNDERDGFETAAASSKSDFRPLSQIVQEMLTHLTELVRSEIRLARAELRGDLAQVARAGVFIAAGAAFGLYAAGFVLLGVVYALGTYVPPWLAALIVGLAVGLIAAIFLKIGRTKLKQADLKPDKTVRSLQENVTWMKKQVR
jgi:hypothetical protein